MAKKKKQFAVIGLGSFGGSLCKELDRMGYDVLAIDQNPEKVEAYIPYSTQTVVADSSDFDVLQSLDIQEFDYVIVAIGEDIQMSVLTTLHLKDLHVKNVWVKVTNSYHKRLLDKIGADRIIQPELDMGLRTAQYVTSENIIDYIDLSDSYSIVELVATAKIHNKTFLDLKILSKYKCNVMALKHGEKVNVAPLPGDTVEENDILVLIGHKRDLKRFEEVGL